MLVIDPRLGRRVDVCDAPRSVFVRCVLNKLSAYFLGRLTHEPGPDDLPQKKCHKRLRSGCFGSPDFDVIFSDVGRAFAPSSSLARAPRCPPNAARRASANCLLVDDDRPPPSSHHSRLSI